METVKYILRVTLLREKRKRDPESFVGAMVL